MAINKNLPLQGQNTPRFVLNTMRTMHTPMISIDYQKKKRMINVLVQTKHRGSNNKWVSSYLISRLFVIITLYNTITALTPTNTRLKWSRSWVYILKTKGSSRPSSGPFQTRVHDCDGEHDSGARANHADKACQKRKRANAESYKKRCIGDIAPPSLQRNRVRLGHRYISSPLQEMKFLLASTVGKDTLGARSSG
jgi:hypothetical protein